jgi:hypothetical protein
MGPTLQLVGTKVSGWVSLEAGAGSEVESSEARRKEALLGGLA